jgi:hypothetical protein
MRTNQILNGLGPPKPYAQLDELEQLLQGLTPPVVNYLSWITGRRSLRMSKRDRLRLSRRVHRFLLVARPYLLGLGAIGGQLDRAQCTYALLEGLLREQYKAAGKRIPANKDAFAYHLDLTLGVKRSKSQLAESRVYAATREFLIEFAGRVVKHVPWPELDRHLTSWSKSPDGLKFAQFIGHWKTLHRQFVKQHPERITTKQVLALAREYSASASFFEQRVRFLVHLSRCLESKPLPWPDMEKQTLKTLLDYMEAHSEFRAIRGIVNRNVRNALAHGLPEIVPNRSEVRFCDRGVPVTWKLGQFFENTRQLTVGVLALAEFESHLQVQQTCQLVEALWRSTSKNEAVVGTSAG